MIIVKRFRAKKKVKIEQTAVLIDNKILNFKILKTIKL